MRLIDADALLKTMDFAMELLNIRGSTETQIGQLSLDRNLVANTGTVEVDPVKHGKWIFEFRWDKCSECGASFEFGGEKEFEFCPRCGAKMEVEE